MTLHKKPQVQRASSYVEDFDQPAKPAIWPVLRTLPKHAFRILSLGLYAQLPPSAFVFSLTFFDCPVAATNNREIKVDASGSSKKQ